MNLSHELIRLFGNDRAVRNHYDGGDNSVLIDDRSKPATKVNRTINLKAIFAPDQPTCRELKIIAVLEAITFMS